MRNKILIAVALWLLSTRCWAQQQVEFTLEWEVKVPKVTRFLSKDDLRAWRERQSLLYLREFDEKLRFWKFTTSSTSTGPVPAASFQIVLEQVGRSNPELRSYAEIRLPGMVAPASVWSCVLLPAGELDGLVSSSTAPVVLDEITDRLNLSFLQSNFRGNVHELFRQAWIADGILELLPDQTIGLPLPWTRLKEASQSVFRIDCDDPTGVLVPLEADGLSRFYSKPPEKYLLAKPRQSMQGLTARRVFVLDWREMPPLDPNFDIAP